jgi:uncharacterized protein involved in copper resistance
MNTIGQRSLAAAFVLALAVGMPAMASAQQHAPDAHAQNTPAQQTAPAQPGQGMGHGDGMDHSKMGQRGMEREHGRMGSGMKQGGSAPTSDSTATTGANPPTNSHTAPSTGSK